MRSLTLFSLMLVLFLDGMGQGIIFPIFTSALFDSNALLLSSAASEATRNVWYGVLVGVFFFCWFIGAAILSDLSDKSGRKKALIICLCGSALGNVLSALAFTMNSIWILLLGRIIVGFTNGSQPIAQASIVDTTPKAKAKPHAWLCSDGGKPWPCSWPLDRRVFIQYRLCLMV